jgi:crotonobetainyl-CoA:carnitine CoA-transferase CaiB-like acyl-CoA transferase
MERLGLGYGALAAINPALIVVSVTPFGQGGPYAHYKAPDLVGMGMAGFMYLTGDPDRPPVRVGVPHFYLHGAASGATGAMIAHAQRVLSRSVNNLIRWMEEEGLGEPFLTGLDWTTLGYGMINKELLDRVVPPVERFLMSHTKAELFEGAVKRRILLFPVSTAADIVQNTQLQARDYFREVTHPDLGVPITYPGPFVRAGATPLRLRRFAPKLGEHNAEIYLDELGLTREDLVRLREAGAV